MSSHSTSLTSEQDRVAVTKVNTAVIAIPGSGKTHTLIHLAINLHLDDPGAEILINTFTKAASKELQERLDHELRDRRIWTKNIKASTFDSTFLAQVKSNLETVEVKTGGDLDNCILRALSSYEIDIPLDEAKTCISFFGLLVDYESYEDNSGFTFDRKMFYQHYIDFMNKNGYQDFAMIARSTCLNIGRSIPFHNARYIVVDEYQDTNPVQFYWLKKHAEAGAKLIVVGDDDQSIYSSFRNLPSFYSFSQFLEHFDPVVYSLTRCFRCKPEILSIADKLIQNNEERIDKTLTSDLMPGGDVIINGFTTKETELEELTTMISYGSPGDYAILTRTQRQLDEFELALDSLNVPYTRTNSKSIWDNNYAISLLKVFWSTVNQKNTKFIREVFAYLGVDEGSLDYLSNQLKRGIPFPNIQLPEIPGVTYVLQTLQSNWGLFATPTMHWNELQNRVNTVKDIVLRARTPKFNSAESKIINIICDILQKKEYGSVNYIDRVNDLSKHLFPKIKKDTPSAGDTVALMTLHGSKGLQFNKVIIPHLNEDTLPSKSALDPTKTGDVNEERRLLYVGMTRAIDSLYLSFNFNPANKRSKAVSRFLYECAPKETSDCILLLKNQEIVNHG